MTADRLHASVLICSYNRADLLREALESIAAMKETGRYRWEVVLVDNNSTDHTRQVVESLARTYPVPLRYLFEPRQGKSYALNTGIEASTADVILFGDDDQRVADYWVDEACRPLFENPAIEYTGGPVWPLWGEAPPAWLDLDRTELRGPLGMFDYGPEPFILEERALPAGGGNMAVRRTLFDRIGMFSVSLGRSGDSLLGQEQAEFFYRSREAGARGLYVPSMQVYHHAPAARLTKKYFRRWWLWRGISRARFDRLHPLTEAGLDLSHVPHLFGVPRFIFGTALRDLRRWLLSRPSAASPERFVRELQLWYFLGYLKEGRLRRRTGESVGAERPETAQHFS